jgi:very-short-patch-repair endonuclease
LIPSPSGEGQGWGTPLKQDAHLLDRAKRLRQNFTPFEAKLWRYISRSQLGGYRFRRQHVIGNCIADFFCPQKALIVELDGDTHDPAKDAIRDRINELRGFTTIRFTNAEVGRNIDGVLEHLLSRLSALPDRWPHPNPSPEGAGK